MELLVVTTSLIPLLKLEIAILQLEQYSWLASSVISTFLVWKYQADRYIIYIYTHIYVYRYIWTHVYLFSDRKAKSKLVKLDHIKEKYFIWNLREDRSLARSLPQSAAATTVPKGHLRSPFVLLPKAHRSPSRNLQHPRNALSQQWRLQPGLRGVCSPAQGSCAVRVPEQSPGRLPKPPSLELGWVTGPYFQSLQKNLHMKLLDGSSLPHCFHLFINQLVKET